MSSNTFKQVNLYKKTEKLLWSYNKFKKNIKDKEEQIEELKAFGRRKRSGSVIPIPENTGIKQDEQEVVQKMIASLELDIFKTRFAVDTVDRAVARYKDVPNSEIITMYYFEGKDVNVIADMLKVNKSTVSRTKAKIVNDIGLDLYTREYIDNLLNMVD